ncbi:MAG: hypothetical protein HC784_11335 [Hydrococcus sp. CSU_1_8]|nr:hypothetical protein [Hydrococcus sp. CSU_1_8]
MQIVSAVGLVGYLSFQNGQQAVNNLVNQLDEASNGQKAVTIWEIWQPHLIWMDMRMPILKILNLTDILLKQK